MAPAFSIPQLLMFPLEERLRICRQLGDTVTAAVEGHRLSPAGGAGRRMILAIWARASSTLSAALLLAEQEYGDQVGMLSRALFEAAVDAYWVAAKPVEAERLATQHFRLTRLVVAEHFNEFERRDGDPALPFFAEDVRDRPALTKLFRTQAQNHWTAKGLPDRIRDVSATFPQDFEGELQIRYASENRLVNLLLHGSPMAINDRISDDRFGNVSIRSGPSTQHLANGLRHAYWSYQRLGLLVAERRSSEARVELQQLYAEGWPRLQTITEPALRAAGRNGLCPCGSGLKVKVCHGAL